MAWFFDLVYLLAGIVYGPVTLYGALVRGKYRRGWAERFGSVPERPPVRQRIWIHGVSLGEINAAPRLVEGLLDRMPDADVVVSSTTDTGFARAVQLFGGNRVFRYPLDFSPVVARALKRLKPALIVLMELEVWPNLVRAARRLGIPVVVVNGRLTVHSARRLRRLGPFTRPMFRRLSWVAAQDETIAERFRQVGVPAERVEVISSLKWDSATVSDSVPGAEALAAAVGLDRTRPVWVCGSTGPGEEAIILDVHRRLEKRIQPARPQLVIVPRKPERFEEVRRLIEDAGHTCIRRSASPDGMRGQPLAETAIVLGDTMGELRAIYSLASVVFVGRTLVPLGGSDLMEVAALRKPMIVGPHCDNFEFARDALLADGALRAVDSAAALAEGVELLISNVFAASDMAQRARQVVVRNQGATARTVDGLLRVVQARITTDEKQPTPSGPMAPPKH